jgi:hypothetical protein
MQIHELNRPRRTDEGIMDVMKSAGSALKQSVAGAAGVDPNAGAASAGILDPDQKLAAVMKNPQMVKLATQYADEWVKTQPAQSAPASQPAPAGETPEQKRIRLQKAAQQNIDKTAVPVPAKPAAPTPADIRQAKQAQAAQAAQAQMSAVKEDTEVATPGTYNKKTGAAKLGGKTMTALSDLPPNVQKQIQAKQDLQQQTGRANPYMTPAAQQPAPAAQQTAAPAPVTNKTTPAAAQGFNASNVMKMPGMEKYAKPAPAPATKTANFGGGPQGYSNTATSVKTAPGQPAAPAKTAPAQQPAPAQQQPAANTAPAQQSAPAAKEADYIKNFLQFANQKTAMRDSTTYRTLGLADAEKSKLKPQLDAAKQEVSGAQGNPAKTKEAVKNYILTALAALQLVASENKVAASTTQAPAYGQPGDTPPGATKPAAGQASADTQAQPIDVNALMKAAGLDPDALTKAGPIIQKATGNGNLSATGDDAIDGMLQLMGYNVS